MLEAEGLIAGYVPEVDILNGVSIVVREGEIVTIVGPNGAGKSTLIKTDLRPAAPARGHVASTAQDIAGRKPHDITRLGMAYVPQLDNVFQTSPSRRTSRWARSTARHREQRDRMYELFPRLGERKARTPGR